MQSRDYIRLIHQKLARQISSEEQKLLSKWLESSVDNQQMATEIEQAWQLTKDYGEDFQVDVDAGLSRLKSRIRTEQKQKTAPVKVLPIYRRHWVLGAAAAILALLVFGWIWTNTIDETSEWAEVYTKEGEKREINLADGSIVWLNENSHLKSLHSFEGGLREVWLEGEAFFDVKKDELKPFLVQTADAEVRVLGTSFNVRSYSTEDQLEVSVKTGSVEVKSKERQRKWVLKPTDQLLLNQGKKEVKLSKDETFNALAWKSRQLRFRNTPMSAVIKDIEHCYGVEIKLSGTDILDCGFSSTFSSVEIKELMKTIATSFGMEVKQQDDKTYLLSGGTCN